ncbi:hypothetical protein AVEN_115365-1 [Araneus ventricosus]|uniref:Uncharacterized protein n=1 Tax=Araneus ventricosus TaxID=182803 RepID=A0A4Y1ZZ37_ARAVE|nr:hypothetical protein AVEN_115365-1 [Araneus ventricosus]
MKPFDFKYGREQETVDEREENVKLMQKSEDEDFGPFQQEMEASEMEEIIYLETSMVDFSTNVCFVESWTCQNESHYSYVCGIQVDGGEYDITGLRTTNLAESNLFR